MKTNNGIIYKITNKLNGKVYIGKTVQKFEHRVQAKNYNSCTAFKNAITCYGWENFEKEVFICALDEDYLIDLEEKAIKYHNCIAPNGYNLVEIYNGLNRFHEDTKKKIGDRQRAHHANLEEPVTAHNRKLHTMIDGVAHKDCACCEKILPISEFTNLKSRWDGKAIYCKECSIAKSRARGNRYVAMAPEEKEKSRLSKNANMSLKLKQVINDNPELKKVFSEKKKKPVIAKNIVSGVETEFASAKDATGFDNRNISTAIKNNKPYKGHMWRFK